MLLLLGAAPRWLGALVHRALQSWLLLPLKEHHAAAAAVNWRSEPGVSPSLGLHSLTVPSLEQDATWLPAYTTAFTQSVWPSKLLAHTGRPLLKLHLLCAA
jgi:hypothetical protein